MISSEQNSLNENSGQEISPEESVLQDLEMVMAQVKLLTTPKLCIYIIIGKHRYIAYQCFSISL